MLKNEWKYLILIIIIFISACIETDIYLPAFPDMMTYFSVGETAIQGLLTWNFVGICLSGPMYGPISDTIGRRKPLLAALAIFFLGSLLTMFTNTFEFVLIGRFLQGIGSGGCFTLGITIIFDTFQSKRAVLAINHLNSTIPFVMALAPMIGAYLNYNYGFRSNFLVIASCVLVSLVSCWLFLGETHPVERRKTFEWSKLRNDFYLALTNVSFWQLTLVISLLFSGYIAFLSTSAVLFVVQFGIDKAIFPYFQAAILGSWLIASISCRSIINYLGTTLVKKIGMTLIGFGGTCFVLTTCFFSTNPYLLTASMMIYAFGVNWVQSLYFPECMGLLPETKGITASLLTSTRLLIAASVVAATSYFYNGSIIPVAVLIGGIAVIVLTLIILYEKKRATVLVQ